MTAPVFTAELFLWHTGRRCQGEGPEIAVRERGTAWVDRWAIGRTKIQCRTCSWLAPHDHVLDLSKLDYEHSKVLRNVLAAQGAIARTPPPQAMAAFEQMAEAGTKLLSATDGILARSIFQMTDFSSHTVAVVGATNGLLVLAGKIVRDQRDLSALRGTVAALRTVREAMVVTRAAREELGGSA